MEIYVTRHGQTTWNINKRLQGCCNSDLTELGIKQAEALRDRLEDIDIQVIYTSPLKRAVDTANILKGNRNIEVICKDGLKELNFGEYEGSIEEELLKEGRGKEISRIFSGDMEARAPKGESLRELYDRIEETLEDILSKEKRERILIVSHGMALKAIMYYFNNKENKFDEIMGQATLTKIIKDNNKYIIELLNDGEHIKNLLINSGW